MLRAVLFGLSVWTVVSVMAGLAIGRTLAFCSRLDAPEGRPAPMEHPFQRAA